MSENIPFPYISYKGKKYADPHAAAKAFLLDTSKKQTDTLNIHDISDTSSIDGAGIDVNGKIWTNTYSFQDHPTMAHLKTAMIDVFKSIKEVMARDNMTLDQVAQKPLSVRPFYEYNGQRYENPEEALSALYNDPNKSPSQGRLMYHNRFDYSGLELAGVDQNNDVWYTQLSEYNNTPAVAAGRAIFKKMITENQLNVESEVQGILLNESNPIISRMDFNNDQMKSGSDNFQQHFSFNGNAYLHAKDAMKAFLDTPADERGYGVTLHTKDTVVGYHMAGQSDNYAKTLWVDQLSDNNNNPAVIAARKEMREMLDAHNVKFPPLDPYLSPARESFKPYFQFDGKKYESGKEAMQAFLDKPEDQRYGSVMFNFKDDINGYPMTGQSDNFAKTVWVDQMSSIPAIVAASKDMREVLDAHNVKFPPLDPYRSPARDVFKPYFQFDGKKYESGKEAMQAFLDKPEDQRYGSVMFNFKDDINGYPMTGQSDNFAKTVWVDQMSSIPAIVAASKDMREVLDAHNVKFPPLDPYRSPAPKQVEAQGILLNESNPIISRMDFNKDQMKSGSNNFQQHFSFNGNAYLHAKDAMKAFLDTPADERGHGVTLHTKDTVVGYHMAGQSDNYAKTVWIDQMSDNSNNPAVIAARKEMNEVLDAHNIKFPPLDPYRSPAPKQSEVQGILLNESNPIISRMDFNNDQMKSGSNNFQQHFSFNGNAYLHAKDAMKAFLDTPADERGHGVTLHTKDTVVGYHMAGQSDNYAKTVWIDQMSDNSNNPAVIAARKEMNEVLDAHNIKFPPLDPYLSPSSKIKAIQSVGDIEFNNVAVTKQPEFPYFKYDNKVYSSANDVMKVFIADRDNNSIKSDILLHVDSHSSSIEAAGHERNGNIWKNQHSFQDHPAMKDFKNAFDKQVNGYKAHLQYLDDVYADNARMVDGYPREVQISDMKEMKKIIDKLPIHNVSDSDMIKIQSYKNDIKNHELSIFLETGTKNNDVKVKNTNTLKIS